MTSTNQTKDSETGSFATNNDNQGSTQNNQGSKLNVDLNDLESLKYALFNELNDNNQYFKARLSTTIETNKTSADAYDKMAEGQLILIKEVAFYRHYTNPGHPNSSSQA